MKKTCRAEGGSIVANIISSAVGGGVLMSIAGIIKGQTANKN